MKKRLVLFMALALCVPAPALAGKGDTWVGVQFGAAIPSGDLGDVAATGVATGVQLIQMDTDRAGMGIEVAFHGWRGGHARSDVLDYFAPGWDYRLRAVQTTGHVLVDVGRFGRVTPYVRGGAGAYWLQSRLGLYGQSVNGWDARIGYHLGAGANLGFGHARALGVEGTVHTFLADGKHWSSAFTTGVSLRTGFLRTK